MKNVIYMIKNSVNGKYYIGSSSDFSKRRGCHISMLRRNKHHSILLQRAYCKYGESAFEFIIIAHCTKNNLITEEQAWMDKLKSYDPRNGYNVNPQACGGICGENARMLLRAWRLGKKHEPETIEKIRQASLGARNHFFGRKHSIKTKQLISQKNIGRAQSAEERAMRSAALTGRIFSEEHKRRIGLANSRRVISVETRLKMRLAKLGKKLSESHRQNMSKAHKRRHARLRGSTKVK